MYKKLTTAVLVGALSSSFISAGDQPYVAFDVVDLGAISRDEDDSLQWTESSFGIAINSINRVAGSSNGSIELTSENPVSGEVTVLNRVLQQPVRFDVVGDTVTLNNFMPDNPDLGFGAGEAGIIPVGINSTSTMVAYASDVEVFETFGRDADNECNTQTTQATQNARKAVTFSELGDVTEIPLGDDFTTMIASAINDAGQVVGRGLYITERDDCTDPSQTATRGFIYEPSNQTVQVLGTLENEGDNQTTAVSNIIDINGSTIVGSTNTLLDGNRVLRGFISTLPAAELTLVEGFGGLAVTLNAVNDNGIAVGGSSSEDDATIVKQAFLYDSNDESQTALGFLSERIRFPFSDAFAINTHSEVVGTSRVTQTPDSFEAFLFDDAQLFNLNDLIDCDAGWVLTEARDITDDGYIVGSGTKLIAQDDGSFVGEVRAFMLRPRSTAADRSCDPITQSSGGGSFGWALLIVGLLGFRRR